MSIRETIKKRFDFVVILTLFFPIILQALYQEDIESYGAVALSWGILVGALIINFSLMEIVDKHLTERELGNISWLLFGNIVLYVPIILILATITETMPMYYVFILLGSLVGLYTCAILVFLQLFYRVFVQLLNKM